MIPRVLVIAGSDSGGGAGIQADIKTITMLGGHAMTAITAVTAQNTIGVTRIDVLPADAVIAQIDAVVGDIGIDAIKIGMLGSAAIADAVARRLATVDVPVVLDPVMAASSGARLAEDATVAAVRRLMARAVVTTPNRPELAVLGGIGALMAEGRTVLVKGGHDEGDEVVDTLVGPGGEIARWSASRIVTRHDHGTGCTLASGIALGMAAGLALPESIGRARAYVRAALGAAPGLGEGHGPMGHGLGRAHFPVPDAGSAGVTGRGG